MTGPDNVVESNRVWRTDESNYYGGGQGRRW